jgi:hypothetical protein
LEKGKPNVALQQDRYEQKEERQMDFQFERQGNYLTIKFYGAVVANERILSGETLTKQLEKLPRRVIVDLSGLTKETNPYILRIINTLKKEVQLLGGAIRLRSLKPKLLIFEYEQDIDQAKRN